MPTLLLADDSYTLRGLMRRILEKAGFAIREAACGLEALQCLEDDGDIQLLIADLVMEDLSGSELAVMAQSRRPSLKILLISSFPREEAIRQGIEVTGSVPASLQYAPFLEKPFSPGQLVRAVDDALRSSAV